jgi:hypothetical protein
MYYKALTGESLNQTKKAIIKRRKTKDKKREGESRVR